jgi:hypothetical protein
MMKSESLTKLIPALIIAKGNFAPALKDKKNDHFGNAYVSLEGVLEATEDHLMDRGLVVVQNAEILGNENFLRTTLYHESGEYISSEYLLRPVKQDPQGYGSAMTYARRYCLMAILGIAPEDDDGNAASGVKSAREVSFKAPKNAPAPAPIPLPAKSSDEINAERMAAGQEPLVSAEEKTSAGASYQILRKLDKEWAAAIKHECGTDYRKMKQLLDVGIAKCKERAANEPKPQ